MERFGASATALPMVLVLLFAFAAGAQKTGVSSSDYNAEGVELYNNEEWAEAVSAFEAAYELDPAHDTIRRNLSNAYMAYANALAGAKDFAGAIDLLESAIGVSPTNPRPLVQLGAYYLRSSLVPEAIFRLEEAVEIAPNDVDAHDLLAQAYYEDNDIPSALEHWDWVQLQDPNRKGLADRIEKARRELSVEQDFRRTDSQHFVINYEPGAESFKVRNLSLILERAYRDIGQELGGVYPPAPIQVNLYTAKSFSEATLMEGHVGGLYDGKIRLPVTGVGGNEYGEEELRRRLYHEYVHVAVRHLLDDNTPWWLNEGLAETLSGDLSTQHVEMLKQAREDNILYYLWDLEGSQLTRLNPDSLNLAYRQSHFTVNYLRSKFGKYKLNLFLQSLAEGMSPEDALKKHYYRNYETLHREIRAELR